MQSAAASTRLSPRKYIYNIIIHYNVGTQTAAGAAEYLPTTTAVQRKRRRKRKTIRRMHYDNIINHTFIIRKLPCYNKNIIYNLYEYAILFVCGTGNRARNAMQIFKLSVQPSLGDRMRRRIKRILKKITKN